jgi:hypothetical protein
MEAPPLGRSDELIGTLRAEIDARGLAHMFSVRYEEEADRVALVRVTANGGERAIRYPADQTCVALIADFLRIEARLVSVRGGNA